jgi:amino-acid N-acetyltransferase
MRMIKGYSQAITIDAAKQDDLPAILALLVKCGLPRDGLADHLRTTLVARESKRIVGCSALELYEDCALIRSVAVDPSFRGQGLGLRLTKAALDMARLHQALTAYLLTTTAVTFFLRTGFKPLSRAEVPGNVRRSIQFTTLCPDTAIAMTASLMPEEELSS